MSYRRPVHIRKLVKEIAIATVSHVIAGGLLFIALRDNLVVAAAILLIASFLGVAWIARRYWRSHLSLIKSLVPQLFGQYSASKVHKGKSVELVLEIVDQNLNNVSAIIHCKTNHRDYLCSATLARNMLTGVYQYDHPPEMEMGTITGTVNADGDRINCTIQCPSVTDAAIPSGKYHFQRVVEPT